MARKLVAKTPLVYAMNVHSNILYPTTLVCPCTSPVPPHSLTSCSIPWLVDGIQIEDYSQETSVSACHDRDPGATYGTRSDHRQAVVMAIKPLHGDSVSASSATIMALVIVAGCSLPPSLISVTSTEAGHLSLCAGRNGRSGGLGLVGFCLWATSQSVTLDRRGRVSWLDRLPVERR